MNIRSISRAVSTATLLFLFTLPVQAQLFLEEIVVFAADTIPKQSVFLQPGKSYDIMCSGTYSFWSNIDGDSVGLVDAAYYRVIPPGEGGWVGLATSASNGFLIDGAPFAPRIVPSGMNPTYNYRVPYIGQGRPATVYIEDHPPFSIDRHADNSGAIRVRIFNVSPEIAVDSSAIDFGEVELGDRRDTVVVFENIGYGPLILSDFSIGGADPGEFTTTAADMYTLQPGERDSIIVSFVPTSIFLKTGFLMFTSNDIDSPVITIPLSGTGVTTLEAGCMNTLTAPAQQFSLLPVTLFTNRDGSLATSYSFDLLYDETLLIPDRLEKRGTLSESFDVNMRIVQPGRLTITASNGQPLTGTGTLLFLRVFAVWDNPPISPLDVENLVFNAGNPRARIIDGAVEIDSLCNQYLKNVHAIGLPRLGPNRPNPFNPSTTMRVFLPASQHVRLSVHDAAGRELRLLVDGMRDAGDHEITFTAADLPSGAYFAVMKTKNGTQVQRMLLLR